MNPSSKPERVIAVVVAYNRRDLLIEVLDALSNQSRRPDEVIVVDNASTDGSAAVVKAAGDGVTLVELSVNTGGAGGFAAGIAVAMDSFDPSWIWLMDDDTVPTPSALAELLRAVKNTETVLAGSRVVWTDGSDHPMNTPREKPFVRKGERLAAARGGNLAVRSSSFVSMFVRADVVRKVGLPIADYFIWNDDFEYSARVLRGRRGVHVPASVVVHKTKALVATDVDPGARFYYEVRNKLWMFLRSDSLSFAEKILYGTSTMVRWVRTFKNSSDRTTLRDGFRSGARDGIRTRPRSNVDVLGLLEPVAEAVHRIERKRG